MQGREAYLNFWNIISNETKEERVCGWWWTLFKIQRKWEELSVCVAQRDAAYSVKQHTERKEKIRLILQKLQPELSGVSLTWSEV